jgi:hypothetical protein
MLKSRLLFGVFILIAILSLLPFVFSSGDNYDWNPTEVCPLNDRGGENQDACPDGSSDNAGCGQVGPSASTIYFWVTYPDGTENNFKSQSGSCNSDCCAQPFGKCNSICGNNNPRTCCNDMNDYSWAGLATVCAYTGQEGDYYFKFRADGDGTDTYGYCYFPQELEVQWDNDKDWCLGASCGNGAWIARECCSAREMDANFLYTNEDCNMTMNSNLCYISQEPTAEGVVKGEYLAPSNYTGEIVYEGCGDDQNTNVEDGAEFVSDGNSWLKCTSAYSGTNPGPITGKNGDDVQVTHEFICLKGLSPRQYSIAECNAVSSREGDLERGRKPGGTVARGGQSVQNVTTNPNCVFICNNVSDWTQDMDDYSKVGDNGVFCNSLYFPPTTYSSSLSGAQQMKYYGLATHWTGSYCCGETDDWSTRYPNTTFNTNNEYYNDDDRGANVHVSTTNRGACFNNWYQANQSFLTIRDSNSNTYEVKEVMVWHGTFQGCAINHDNALANYQSNVQTVKCAPVNNTHKPYEGSFNSSEASAEDYGFTGGHSNDFLLSLSSKPNSPQTGTKQCVDTGAAYAGCTDSDGGNYPYVKGTVTAPLATGSDLCCDGVSCPTGTVQERTCGGGNYITTINYACPNGCSNGACIGTAPVTTTGSLITDNYYCSILNWSSESYYCSYTEKWEQNADRTRLRTHLSFIPWMNDSAQQAECCAPDQCWDGSVCVDSVTSTLDPTPNKIMNSRGDGFICKNGNWEWTFQKTAYDGSMTGYCLENTQCLVDNAGEYSLTNVFGPIHYAVDEIGTVNIPACINNSEYYLDHYCENGTWTSRTKFAALELLKLAESDYTLYCDRYDKVLNKLDYTITGDPGTVKAMYFQTSSSSRCLTYEGTAVPCANHVCVLVNNPKSTSPSVIMGTSINHRLNKTSADGSGTVSVYDFGNALGGSLTSCASQEGKSDTMTSCGNSIYYNGKRGLVLFSKSKSTTGASSSYSTLLLSLFTSFIKTFVEQVAPSTSSGYDYSMLDALAEDLFTQATSTSPVTDNNIPNFECTNCSTTQASICGEWSNPRKVYDLNTLFLSKVGSKSIFGMAEYEAYSEAGDTSPTLFYGLMFKGFTQDMCQTFNYPATVTGYKCTPASNNYYITAVTTAPALEISYDTLVDRLSTEHWIFLGPSNRVQ